LKIKAFKKRYIVIFVFCLILFSIFRLFFFSDILIKFFYHEKIWVHRVNSIEKLQEVKNDFFGVELDIVFLDSLNTFDVTHPPEPSIDLSLFDYMSASNSTELHFWLDFKNLDHKNSEQSAIRLIAICDELGVSKDRVIVESTRINAVNQFKDAGFKVSYYLPWPGLHQLANDSLIGMINLIKVNVNKYQPDQISSNYHDYHIMKNEFPMYSKLFWLTGSETEHSNLLKERLFLYEILRDDKVSILLLEYDSKTGNR
jgi:hypothetical protein